MKSLNLHIDSSFGFIRFKCSNTLTVCGIRPWTRVQRRTTGSAPPRDGSRFPIWYSQQFIAAHSKCLISTDTFDTPPHYTHRHGWVLDWATARPPLNHTFKLTTGSAEYLDNRTAFKLYGNPSAIF